VSFGNQTVGSTSSAHSVTVSNTGSAAARSRRSRCRQGSPDQHLRLVHRRRRLVHGVGDVRSHRRAAYTGNLTVASNATNSPLNVALSGTGVGNTTTNLALNKSITASSNQATRRRTPMTATPAATGRASTAPRIRRR
jgi:hypothetical protein